ncbi:MAG: magnesium/cobalt transporter CorA [bacterium]
MKKKKKINRKIGQPAGTLEYMGAKPNLSPKMSLIEYDKGECVFRDIKNIKHLDIELNNDITPKLRWLRISGVGKVEFISELCNYFKIHPLTIEDILNPFQRAKIEDYENYTFTVVKNLFIDKSDMIVVEEIDIVLMGDLMITFYDNEQNPFKQIDDRLLGGKGAIRNSIDYLYYIIIDFMVDNYFSVMDELGENIESLYEELIEFYDKDGLLKIKKVQKEMHKIRQAIFPFREVLNRLQKQELNFIKKESLIYFRDISDHYSHILETYEANKELIYSMLDVYMSGISNKSNEVMKVLTIISTIFIPLTFIAGVYGMNFKNMPELEYKYGYFIVWGIMIVIGTVFGLWFKKKKWY